MQLFPVMALLEGRCAFEAVQQGAADAELQAPANASMTRSSSCAAIAYTDGYYRANHVFHSQRAGACRRIRWLDRATNDLRKLRAVAARATAQLAGPHRRIDRVNTGHCCKRSSAISRCARRVETDA